MNAATADRQREATVRAWSNSPSSCRSSCWSSSGLIDVARLGLHEQHPVAGGPRRRQGRLRRGRAGSAIRHDPSCGTLGGPVCPATTAVLQTHVTAAANRMVAPFGPSRAARSTSSAIPDDAPTGAWTSAHPSDLRRKHANDLVSVRTILTFHRSRRSTDRSSGHPTWPVPPRWSSTRSPRCTRQPTGSAHAWSDDRALRALHHGDPSRRSASSSMAAMPSSSAGMRRTPRTSRPSPARGSWPRRSAATPRTGRTPTSRPPSSTRSSSTRGLPSPSARPTGRSTSTRAARRSGASAPAATHPDRRRRRDHRHEARLEAVLPRHHRRCPAGTRRRRPRRRAATAAGGPPGDVFPVGIAQAFFDGRQPCSGPVSTTPGDPCYPATPDAGQPERAGRVRLAQVRLLRATASDRARRRLRESKPFLQSEIGPPADSYGCCTQVGLPGSPDNIGSLPGNKASADCCYYITTTSWCYVPVWDYGGGTGSNGYYHIVRIHRFPDHGVPRRQGYRGRLARAVLRRSDDHHAWFRGCSTGGPARSLATFPGRKGRVETIWLLFAGNERNEIASLG